MALGTKSEMTIQRVKKQKRFIDFLLNQGWSSPYQLSLLLHQTQEEQFLHESHSSHNDMYTHQIRNREIVSPSQQTPHRGLDRLFHNIQRRYDVTHEKTA